MNKQMSVSEVRKSLPKLLKRFQKKPGEKISITVHGAVVGELRAPDSGRPQVRSGEALLRAMDSLGEPTENYPPGRHVARDHDSFLYQK